MLPHCFHCIAQEMGIAFLISVNWLNEAIMKLHRIIKTNSRDVQLFNDEMRKESLSSTQTLVFPTTSQLTLSDLWRHQITSVTVIQDPSMGHISVYRTLTANRSSSSSFSCLTAVNITVLLSTVSQEHRLQVNFSKKRNNLI